MIRRIAINAQPLALSLKLTNIRTYGIIAVFVVLSVLVPWVFHQFHLAGATYLPMHFFVFIAALSSGWQAGLIVGLLTPFASYLVSGMPVWNVLPQIAVEITVYGWLAGILRQKFNLRIIWSLLGAMLGGRLALLLAVVIIEVIKGVVYSPLGPEAGPYLSVGHTIRQAWPGILGQVILIPVIFWAIGRFSRKKQPE